MKRPTKKRRPNRIFHPDLGEVHGGHWVAIADADADRISNSQTCLDFALAITVWYILCRECSYRRSYNVTLSDSLLVKRTGLSRTSVRKATGILEGLGLIKSSTTWAKGSHIAKAALTRTLFPSAPLWKDSPCSLETQASCVSKEHHVFSSGHQKKTDSYTPSEEGGVKKVGSSITSGSCADGAAGVSSTQKPAAQAAAPVAATIQPPARPQGPWKCVAHEPIGYGYKRAVLENKAGDRTTTLERWALGECGPGWEGA